MSKALTKQELHNLAMNHVGKDLESRGFEFVAVNSKLKKHPQFVCIDKKGNWFFVIVSNIIFLLIRISLSSSRIFPHVEMRGLVLSQQIITGFPTGLFGAATETTEKRGTFWLLLRSHCVE